MTSERINEILEGVQELREWRKALFENNAEVCAMRQNGKSMLAFRYALSIEIACTALYAAEKCSNCVHFNTRVCAECVYGCDTDYFTQKEETEE